MPYQLNVINALDDIQCINCSGIEDFGWSSDKKNLPD